MCGMFVTLSEIKLSIGEILWVIIRYFCLGVRFKNLYSEIVSRTKYWKDKPLLP